MSSDLSESVVLITSSDLECKTFGTGFIIYWNEPTTYLLTCAHVVRDVGGAEKVTVNGIPAKVIASGEKDCFDLAVLRVEELLEKPPLNLCVTGEQEKQFIIVGFYKFDPKSPPALRKIQGNLGEQIKLASGSGRERINAWDLKIDGEYYLQPGYSGSPVIDATNNCVLGVVSHQIGKGEKGLAISIDALGKIWSEMQLALCELNLQEKKEQVRAEEIAVQAEIELVENKRAVLEREIEKDSPFKKSAKWLYDNKTILAKRAGKYALENEAQFIEISAKLDSKRSERFYKEIERHLELIHGSLITESYDLLHEPRLRRSIPAVTAYQAALWYIEQRVPGNLNLSEREELIKRIQYLSSRLS